MNTLLSRTFATKPLLLGAAVLLGTVLGTSVSTASAQYIPGPVTTYYAPAGPVVAPVYTPPVVYPTNRITYYAPGAVAPASYYSPVPTYSSFYTPAPVITPAAPVVVARGYSPYTPYVVARPVVAGRTIFGTRQVYVPGQPVLNTVRAVTP
jgi:hypothetical protein